MYKRAGYDYYTLDIDLVSCMDWALCIELDIVVMASIKPQRIAQIKKQTNYLFYIHSIETWREASAACNTRLVSLIFYYKSGICS